MLAISYASGIRGTAKTAGISFGKAGFNIHERPDDAARIICRIRTTDSLDLGLKIIGTATPDELAACEDFWKLVRIAQVAKDQSK